MMTTYENFTVSEIKVTIRSHFCARIPILYSPAPANPHRGNNTTQNFFQQTKNATNNQPTKHTSLQSETTKNSTLIFRMQHSMIIGQKHNKWIITTKGTTGKFNRQKTSSAPPSKWTEAESKKKSCKAW